MSDLIVIAFDDEASAFDLRAELVRMQREYLLQLEDAVVVTRQNGKLQLHQAVNMTGIGAAGGTMWGALIGLIFLNPLAGAALGLASGALAGKLTDIGIQDDFIREVAEAVPAGGSAVFVLVRRMTADKVLDRLKQIAPRGRIMRTSLSQEEEERLKAALSADDVPAEPTAAPRV